MRLATEIDRGGKILKIAEVNQWLCPQKKKLAEELMRCCCGILWGIMWSRKPKPKWVSGTGENVLRKSNFGKKGGGERSETFLKKKSEEENLWSFAQFCFVLICSVWQDQTLGDFSFDWQRSPLLTLDLATTWTTVQTFVIGIGQPWMNTVLSFSNSH